MYGPEFLAQLCDSVPMMLEARTDEASGVDWNIYRGVDWNM